MIKDLHLIGTLPGWLIALGAVAVAALLALQFVQLRQRLALRDSLVLTALRGCVYGVLLFFLFGPALVERRETRLRRPLTVLIDNSQSMNFPSAAKPDAAGKSGPSRLDRLKEKLSEGQEPLLQRLNRDYDLRVFSFGAGMEPITPAGVADLNGQEHGTRLIETVQSVAKDASRQSGIVVFSDGISNGEHVSIEGSPTLPVPVFTVGLGDAEGFTDLRIADLKAPQFAFRGREFKLDLLVKASGLKGRTVPLYFNRGRNLITSHSVTINADQFEQKVSLSFTPRELGTHGFSVSLPAQPGEQLTQNNHREFKVDVRRDKLRVLTLSGAPAWNYRFLRMALKQDPLIELVSFVFLRTPTDSVDVPDSQLSLIPFPIDDIFLEELKNFDVVVLDDFSHRSYFNPVYLERIRDFVRDGGGLAMFGGVRGFDSGGYGESVLKEVLPVELDGKGVYQNAGNLRPALTPVGKAHPITRLLPDPRANEEAWNKMPPLTGYNQVRAARGETLVTAAGEGSAGAVPLLTIGRFGKGRTLALMSDQAWRWNFMAAGNRETPQNHLKLIRQAVRWLAQEPSFEQVQIQPISGSQPGERIAIKLRVLKDDFTPARNASVQLRVFGPDGEPMIVPAVAHGEEGDFAGEYIPVREGAYRVEAEATLGDRALGRDHAGFSVAYPYGESNDGQPRHDLLKQIADSSQGEYFSIDDWNEESLARIAAKLEEHAPSSITEQSQVKLSSTIWPFAVVLLLLSIEWWMRRKWGLI
jgi:uncharacterized membrane protein